MDSIHLSGAEDVRSAANTMSSAADRMRSAADSMHSAADTIRNVLYDHQCAMERFMDRFEAAVEKMSTPTLIVGQPQTFTVKMGDPDGR